MPQPDPMNERLAIEVQMRGEAAGALKAAARAVEQKLAELEAARAALEAAPPEGQAAELERYRALRGQAVHLRWCLTVQREAMGLLHHEGVYAAYPLPPAR